MTEASGEVLHEKIAHLEHLNAIINETLRLHPPVPSLLQRKTPPEGITVEGTYIPGNTVVACPQYVLGRSKFQSPRNIRNSLVIERGRKFNQLMIICFRLLQVNPLTQTPMPLFQNAGTCTPK